MIHNSCGGDIMALNVKIIDGEPVIELADRIDNSIIIEPQIVDGVLVYNIVD